MPGKLFIYWAGQSESSKILTVHVRLPPLYSSGELVVSEDCKVSIISRDGERIRSINATSVRSGIRRYKLNPLGVAGDEDSNIYVTDTESHKFSSNGKLVKSVGGESGRTGQFDCSATIAG